MAQPTSSALRALALEYKSLQEEPVEGFRVKLVNEDNMFEWEVAIFGPPDTLYQGGYFKVLPPCCLRCTYVRACIFTRVAPRATTISTVQATRLCAPRRVSFLVMSRSSTSRPVPVPISHRAEAEV